MDRFPVFYRQLLYGIPDKGKIFPFLLHQLIFELVGPADRIIADPVFAYIQYNGKNFYIVDDIYATGNTMKAIEKAIEELGGTIIGKGVIMNIIELNNDKQIFSLLDINEEGA